VAGVIGVFSVLWPQQFVIFMLQTTAGAAMIFASELKIFPSIHFLILLNKRKRMVHLHVALDQVTTLCLFHFHLQEYFLI